MSERAAVEELPVESWTGPFDPAIGARAADALEGGRVLLLPRLAFPARAEEQAFFADDVGPVGRKNISLDPATGKLGGSGHTGAAEAAMRAMLTRYAEAATALVSGLVPRYAPALERARTSFRPSQVSGRAQSPRHDDRRLHVDAFPTRPMRGRRILRVFTNVTPDGSAREWRVGEPFEDFARAFLPRVKAPLPGTDLALGVLGLTRGRRSRYDRIMLSLHDAAKLDETYQQAAPRTAVSFPPGSTWLVFTDQVLHAAIGGRFAMEQTFHLPVAAMMTPERAPIRVLERLSGRALA